MAKKLKAAKHKLVQRATIPEPFLTIALDGFDGNEKDPLWHAKALEELARQVTFRNDFYYPLLGASERLRLFQRAQDAFMVLARSLGPPPSEKV